MELSDFLDYVKTGAVLDAPDICAFMHEMSEEARRITFELNSAYHTPDKVRALVSRLIGKEVDSSFRLFPPFYTDFGKNITVGRNVFINACCHFQDHGGVTIGDGCQIGHAVVFATPIITLGGWQTQLRCKSTMTSAREHVRDPCPLSRHPPSSCR